MESQAKQEVPGAFHETFDWRLPLLGIAGVAAMGVVYCYRPFLYYSILQLLMANPFRYPFVDLDMLLGAKHCYDLGVDVYLDNPCNVLNVGFNYSPFFLRLAFLPFGPGWTRGIGLAMLMAFFCSLGALPKTKGTFGPMALAMAGSLPVFAYERANLDILIFAALVIAAKALAGRPALRAAGYALIAFVALLKFYPLAAFVIAARERLRNAIGLLIAVVIGIAAFLLAFKDELPRVKLPHPGTFSDSIGARDLPKGLSELLGWSLRNDGFSTDWVHGAASATATVVWILLAAAFVYSIVSNLRRQSLVVAIVSLPLAVQISFALGAAALCGSFFLIDNIGYRGVYLLMTLPALVGLSQRVTTIRDRRLMIFGYAASVYLLWMLTIQQVAANIFGGEFFPISGSYVGYGLWVLRELFWWGVVSILSSGLLALTLHSRAIKELQEGVWPRARKLGDLALAPKNG